MHLQGPPGSVCANEMVFEATGRKHTFSNCQKAGKLLQEVNVLSLHLSIDFFLVPLFKHQLMSVCQMISCRCVEALKILYPCI